MELRPARVDDIPAIMAMERHPDYHSFVGNWSEEGRGLGEDHTWIIHDHYESKAKHGDLCTPLRIDQNDDTAEAISRRERHPIQLALLTRDDALFWVEWLPTTVR